MTEVNRRLVVLDIEATGPDTQHDQIIEIGMIRATGFEVEEELSFLIRPSVPIPQKITSLTGISDEMVKDAAELSAVAQKIEAFVGDALVVGHNIGVDMAFLMRGNLLTHNPTLDTHDLASVLLPEQEHYSLRSLANVLEIDQRNSHRALDDARATFALLVSLYRIALNLPGGLVQQIIRMGWPINWNVCTFFDDVLGERLGRGELAGENLCYCLPDVIRSKIWKEDSANTMQSRHIGVGIRSQGYSARVENSSAFQPALTDTMVTCQGHFASQMCSMLDRPGIKLLEIENQPEYLMACFVSASAWAIQTGKQVILAIPDYFMQKTVQESVKNVLAFGSAPYISDLHDPTQYLCPRRLEFLLSLPTYSREQARVLAKILIWLQKTTSFLRYELNIRHYVEQAVWSQVCWMEDYCSAVQCKYREEELCPGSKALRDATCARAVFSTHQDIILSPELFSGRHCMVLDEIGQLPENIAQTLKEHYTQAEIGDLLKRVAWLTSLAQNEMRSIGQVAAQEVRGAVELTKGIQGTLDTSQTVIASLLDLLGLCLLLQRKKLNYEAYNQHVHITRGIRMKDEWAEITQIWQEASAALGSLNSLVTRLMMDLSETKSPHAEDLHHELALVQKQLLEQTTALNDLVTSPSPQKLYWADVQTSGKGITLSVIPLDISAYIQRIFVGMEASVLTSSALRVQHSWEFIKKSLRLDISECITMDPEPNWKSKVLFYWVKSMPAPDDLKYKSTLEYNILKIYDYLDQSILLLFNSSGFLRSVLNSIGHSLEKRGVEVIDFEHTNTTEVLRSVEKPGKRALFSTYRQLGKGSLPAGIFPIIVFTRFPLQDLSHPTAAALVEQYKDPFNEYLLPEAVRSFKLAFQYLAHGENARSVAILMDGRVLSWEYGRVFLTDLPLCTVESGNLLHLVRVSMDWLVSQNSKTCT